MVKPRHKPWLTARAPIVKKITFEKGLDFSRKCAYNNKCQGEMKTASAKRATP